ncbi:hypothetical protein RMCBS344292_12888 [Rhizopus microsporus]|nr:hypothetical protein RMCBS344292_12888 [Rhizopus microsporus]
MKSVKKGAISHNTSDTDQTERRGISLIRSSSSIVISSHDPKRTIESSIKNISRRRRHQNRVGSWSASSTVSQDQNDKSTRTVQLVGIHNQLQLPNTNKPPHNKPYVKTKTKFKTSKRFHRIVLAQTLAVDTTDVYATAGLSVNGIDEEENAKHPLDAIWAISFSKDGKYMATGGQNCVINVWKVLRDLDRSDNMSIQDISPHQPSIKVFHDIPIRVYTGHKADVLDICWSKSNFLISGSMDKTVRLWHISQDICLCVFQHLDIVTSVKFHPKDDRFFLSGSMDSRLRLWSIPEKRVAFWNEIQNGNMITAVGFTIDGKTACAGASTGDVFFFETQGLKFNTQILVKSAGQKHGKKVTGIEPMPNLPSSENRIIVTTNDSKIWMINIKDKSVMYKYKGLDNTTMQIRAKFSDDGRYIVSGSEDGRVYLWCTDQVTYFPFQHIYENYIKSPRLNDIESKILRIMQEERLPQYEPRGISGWLKKGGRKVSHKLRSLDESFHAHEHIVTSTAFAPTKTKQLLASAGGDIIFDNTPVYAFKEVDYGNITQNRTDDSSASSSENHLPSSKSKRNSQLILDEAMPEERQCFNYPDSQIIVSADLHGSIKVWRMDSGIYDAETSPST